MLTHEIKEIRTIGTDVFVDIWVKRNGRYIASESIQYYFDEQFDHAVSVRLSKYSAPDSAIAETE
jgi:hypothetical protein